MITLYQSVYAVQVIYDYSTSDVPRLSVLVASFALQVRINEDFLFFVLELAELLTLSSTGDNDCFAAQGRGSLARGLGRRYCRYYWYLQV